MSPVDVDSVLGHGLVGGEGYPLLDPANVRAGVDRGDGVLGTLTPYPSTALDETDNPLQALRQLLLEISAIVAACGTRVYVQRLPVLQTAGGEPDPPDLPCILIYSNADNTNPEIPDVWITTFTVKCYGATQSAANAIYRLIKAKDGTAQQSTGFRFHYLEEIVSHGDILEQITDSKTLDCVVSQWTAEISAL